MSHEVSAVPRLLQEFLDRGLEEGLFTGAAAGVSSPRGRFFAYSGTHATGDATRVGPESLFDLASVTKTFTAATAVRLAEQGRVDLDARVGDLLQVGTGPHADEITLRMLLTHVSGLPAESDVWREPGISADARRERVLASTLEARPATRHAYSCVGYIAAGAVLEKATGRSLADLIDDLVSRPLGLHTVSFGPVDAEAAVATEAQPWAGTGMLRGEVHDELSRSLGGNVGNAGLFATADDALAFAESMLDERLFGAASLRSMTTDQIDAQYGADYGQALGPRVRDREFLGDLDAVGHLGFTGTMWLAARDRRLAAVLLTNRVHPHRDRVDLGGYMQRFSALAAASAPAAP